ncbi:MAG TPA: ZIP family metal transporter [Candidatus Bathyarchaeia archaeon]|nr:ZIP family metal transporter [Candidatus Bathyarchaeia archaeon]
MAELILILTSVTIVSLVSFIGILFVGLKQAIVGRLLMVLVGFASGSLIGVVFFDLIPEAAETGQAIWLYIVAGIVFFFVMEKFLYWRHCHDETCKVHSFAYMNLIGDGIHNFVDGALIAASFLVSASIGFTTSLAVVFHEIPQELGDFGVLVYGGLERKKAMIYNFLSALTAVAGALVAYILASQVQSLPELLVPFAAGGFIYIAATDLMPELHKRTQAKDSVIQLLTLLAGIALMYILETVLPSH